MKKTTIILSALMVMLCSSGVAYAEAGEGKPLEVEKTEVSIQKQNNNEKAYNFTRKIDNEKNNSKGTSWEMNHKMAHERSEER